MTSFSSHIVQNSLDCSYNDRILRVCSETNQGMRKYMEDEVSVVIEKEDQRTAFLGVFDGHGGKEASLFAKFKLYENIKLQDGFYDSDPEKVKVAIKEGFLKTHWDMFRVVENWPKRKDGQNSTSGTTATIAIIRGNKLFIAHVGDSAAVIGTKSSDGCFSSTDLTIDHKPENEKEKLRIESLGGRVAATNGVPRVVWKRIARNVPPSVEQPNTRYEYVPFLAVSRALGDLWSYDKERQQFIVSPEPEVEAIDIIPGYHKFIILASDGLWGVMNGEEAVKTVKMFETNSSCKADERNCSRQLVNKSLTLWQRKRSRADNISAIVAFFDNELESCVTAPQTTNEADIDTDVAVSDNEDDTPPMSKMNSNCTLIRQLAMGKPEDLKYTVKNLGPTSEHINGGKKEAVENLKEKFITAVSDNNALGKRKTIENTLEGQQKKVRINSPVTVLSEDSHQSNVITVLSTESLYELQLDEDIGFADTESDEEDDRRKSKRTLTRNSLVSPILKSIRPVVIQGAK